MQLEQHSAEFFCFVSMMKMPVQCYLCNFSLHRVKSVAYQSQNCWLQRIVQHGFIWLTLPDTTSLVLCQKSLIFFPHRNLSLWVSFPQRWCLQPHWEILQSPRLVSFKFSLKECCPLEDVKIPVVTGKIWSNRIFCFRHCKSLCQMPYSWNHRTWMWYFGSVILF